MLTKVVAVTLLLVAIATCSGNSGGPGGTTPDGGGSTVGKGNGHLRATIDGQDWVSDQLTTQVTARAATPGALTITGTRAVSATNYLSLTIALGYVNGPREYPLGVNPGTSAGGTATVYEQSGGATGFWMTDLVGARGSVVITSMTGGRIAGSFHFTAPPQLGSTVTTTKDVTNGDFDLAMPSGFAPQPSDDYGSTISATIDGQPWNGATVVGVGNASAGGFSLGGMTTTISLSLTTQVAVKAGGVYDQTAVRIMASGSGAYCCWGGTGDVSSVEVTTISGKRIAAKFTATLVPGAGGMAAGPLVIAGGQFDVRVDSK
jgi:hypothetical protein